MDKSINVIYSANVASMDSWDIENLKYLRKLSKCNPSIEKDSDTMSYRSLQSHQSFRSSQIHGSHQTKDSSYSIKNSDELLDSAIYSSNGSLFLKKSIRSGRRESQTLKEMVLRDINNNVISGPQLDQASLPTLALNNCYIMDVVMVRNESVLTDKSSVPLLRPSKSPEIELVPELGKEIHLLRELTSSPSSISSDDSFTSAIAKGFFDMDERKSHSCRSIRRKQKPPVQEARLSEIKKPITTPITKQTMPTECPFCGGCGRTDSFSSRKSKLEDIDELRASSVAPTVGDIPPLLEVDKPKTPSPYYVRLRTDLVSSTSPTLSLKKPTNFALDIQGQLVIDYSSNWESLGTYVKNLTECK